MGEELAKAARKLHSQPKGKRRTQDEIKSEADKAHEVLMQGLQSPVGSLD